VAVAIVTMTLLKTKTLPEKAVYVSPSLLGKVTLRLYHCIPETLREQEPYIQMPQRTVLLGRAVSVLEVVAKKVVAVALVVLVPVEKAVVLAVVAVVAVVASVMKSVVAVT
jgi:hypothetical protein